MGQNLLVNLYSLTQTCLGGAGGGEGAGQANNGSSGPGNPADLQSGGGGGGACAMPGAGGFAGGLGSRGWIKIEEYWGGVNTLITN